MAVSPSRGLSICLHDWWALSCTHYAVGDTFVHYFLRFCYMADLTNVSYLIQYARYTSLPQTFQLPCHPIIKSVYSPCRLDNSVGVPMYHMTSTDATSNAQSDWNATHDCTRFMSIETELCLRCTKLLYFYLLMQQKLFPTHQTLTLPFDGGW